MTVVDETGQGKSNCRLRISVDTRGTRDETVKFVGVRSGHPLLVTNGTHLSANLDWNNQTNGSYLSAAVILSPRKTNQNPLKTPEWLKIEYVGVPPGQNARMSISLTGQGRERILYTEGWPEANRSGRKIAQQKITFEILDQSLFRILENDQLVYESKLDKIPFRRAYLYLQVSSHSNYANRSIYFDNIQVSGHGVTADMGSGLSITHAGLTRR
ncbi:MAG: hypothetical protein ACR65R_09070 [Methylomicrobium sp.]